MLHGSLDLGRFFGVPCGSLGRRLWRLAASGGGSSLGVLTPWPFERGNYRNFFFSLFTRFVSRLFVPWRSALFGRCLDTVFVLCLFLLAWSQFSGQIILLKKCERLIPYFGSVYGLKEFLV
jgi:hypothetical protein